MRSIVCLQIKKSAFNVLFSMERNKNTQSHLISPASSFLAGLPSAILSTLTGFDLIVSRMMSYMNDLGALVLIDPEEACDRETS